jgi:PhnB protein
MATRAKATKPAKEARPGRSGAGRAAAKPRSARPKSTRADAAAPSLVPCLAVEDAPRAIAWYREAFGAREAARRTAPGGKVAHAELRIGEARFFLSDAPPGPDVEHPTSLGGTTASLHLRAPDVDRLWARAVSAGGQVTVPLANRPWGERSGRLRDPFGHSWALSWPVGMSAEEKARLEAEASEASGPAGPGP